MLGDHICFYSNYAVTFNKIEIVVASSFAQASDFAYNGANSKIFCTNLSEEAKPSSPTGMLNYSKLYYDPVTTNRDHLTKTCLQDSECDGDLSFCRAIYCDWNIDLDTGLSHTFICPDYNFNSACWLRGKRKRWICMNKDSSD